MTRVYQDATCAGVCQRRDVYLGTGMMERKRGMPGAELNLSPPTHLLEKVIHIGPLVHMIRRAPPIEDHFDRMSLPPRFPSAKQAPEAQTKQSSPC